MREILTGSAPPCLWALNVLPLWTKPAHWIREPAGTTAELRHVFLMSLLGRWPSNTRVPKWPGPPWRGVSVLPDTGLHWQTHVPPRPAHVCLFLPLHRIHGSVDCLSELSSSRLSQPFSGEFHIRRERSLRFILERIAFLSAVSAGEFLSRISAGVLDLFLWWLCRDNPPQFKHIVGYRRPEGDEQTSWYQVWLFLSSTQPSHFYPSSSAPCKLWLNQYR